MVGIIGRIRGGIRARRLAEAGQVNQHGPRRAAKAFGCRDEIVVRAAPAMREHDHRLVTLSDLDEIHERPRFAGRFVQHPSAKTMRFFRVMHWRFARAGFSMSVKAKPQDRRKHLPNRRGRKKVSGAMPKKIAVLFGGSSPEHDVSVVTAQQVMDAVDPAQYEIVPVYVDFENRFFTGPRLRDVSTYRPKPSGVTEVSFGWGQRGAEVRPVKGPPIPIACAMPVFHGLFGEDGRIHGLLEWLGIPVTGFSATHSALAMRKDLTKTVAADVGVPVVPHVVADHKRLGKGAALVDEVIARNIGFPAIVKPVNLGSSIGVGIAKTPEEMLHLSAMVLTRDSLVMIEPRVPNLVRIQRCVAECGRRDRPVRHRAAQALDRTARFQGEIPVGRWRRQGALRCPRRACCR